MEREWETTRWYSIRHIQTLSSWISLCHQIYQKRENAVRRARMAECVASNNSRDLWWELKKMRPNACAKPPQIDGKRTSKDINGIFYSEYQYLYNSVPSDVNEVESFVKCNIDNVDPDDFEVDGELINEAISMLKPNKNGGDKGLVSTLVIHAPAAWRVILGKLISCMIKHGHYAEEILLSTILSSQKDARGNSCCSDNYRGIALTSAINKVVDWVILLECKGNLSPCHTLLRSHGVGTAIWNFSERRGIARKY